MTEYLMPFTAFAGPVPGLHLAKPDTSCFMKTRMYRAIPSVMMKDETNRVVRRAGGGGVGVGKA
jgi:hypothetical protein